MKLQKLISGDMRFQRAYGFYFLYGIYTAVYIALLWFFPAVWREKAAAVMIFSDPAAFGLFCMGAVILLEKSGRVLNALAVSPVSVSAYILSKVLSLALLSVLVSLLLALAAGCYAIPLRLLSVALTSGCFTLLGLILASGAAGLNQYLMVTVPLEAICFLPPLIQLFWPGPVLFWHPFSSSMRLITGDDGSLAYDLTVLILLFGCLFFAARCRVTKMWRKLGGAL